MTVAYFAGKVRKCLIGPMRILIYGLNFSPELTGIGKYTGELAHWLVSRGYDVRVVTAPPYYPEWRVGKGYSGCGYKREVIGVPLASFPSTNNVTPTFSEGTEVLGHLLAETKEILVYRCPLWVPARPARLNRILHLASFAFSSLPVLARLAFWRPDLVFVIEPTFFCVPGALLLARLLRARAWLHIQDFELDAAFGLGMLRRERLRHLMATAERWLMERFDRVSTISERMLERVLQKTKGRAYCLMFPNWVDICAVFPLDRQSDLRREWGIGAERVVLLYAGNMGEKQGLEMVIEAARELVEEGRFLFVMCGAGAAEVRLRSLGEGLENILWRALQPVERLNELLNLADIHLLPQLAEAADLVMPSKLTGMLASGRPIVATAKEGTQVATVVKESGIVVEPEDLIAFVKAIRHLADDTRLRFELGMAARRYAEEVLEREKVLMGFEQEMAELFRGGEKE